jgi:hypothetical protein
MWYVEKAMMAVKAGEILIAASYSVKTHTNTPSPLSTTI